MHNCRRKTDTGNIGCWTHIKGRIRWLLFLSQTSAVRMWFAVASLGFASFMIFASTVHNADSEYRYMLKLLPDISWGVLFAIHGGALLYGVITRQFNTFLLFLEGVLGTVLWVSAAVAMTYAQDALGAATAGAFIALWICLRYPTRAEYLND